MSKGKTEDAKQLDDQGFDVSEEDKKGLEDEQFSSKVKNLGSKSLRQIGKWNNESFLYAFDKQLISFGIRLLLFLPGFAILAFFGAWAYANSSPNWWVDFIEPTIGQSFSSILVVLVFVILLGYILSLALHRHRVNLTIKLPNLESLLTNSKKYTLK